MNPLFQSLFYSNRHGKDKQAYLHHSITYKEAKSAYRFRVLLRRGLNEAALIIIGILSAGFGLKGFLLPNKFIDGGATGISLLISQLGNFPLPAVLILVNLPFMYLAYKQIGRGFALKTILAIIGLAIAVAFINYPVITNDKLLIAVFGGFFLGAGIGLAVRGGCVIDGTEVLAIYLSRKSSGTIGDVIMIINVLIFSAAAYFLSMETALYAMLTYLAASKTVDFIIEGLEEYTAVTIVSAKSDEIRQMIIEKLGRGITVYSGKRGFGKSGHKNYEMDILYTVITRLEISKLYTELAVIDPNAFVVMNSVKDMKGGMIKKRPLTH